MQHLPAQLDHDAFRIKQEAVARTSMKGDL
jgi:urease accessory protein UreE